MIGFELAFLSALMAASPTTPTPWYIDEDYPFHAFERKWEGTTIFELTVDPRGRPVGCTVDVSSGHAILDERACSVALKRAKFQPALDAKGNPTYGVHRTRLNWAIDPELWAQSEAGPDFEVSVSKLPAGADGPVSVQYAVLVDAAGVPVDCRALTPNFGGALNDVGCAKIKADYRRAAMLAPGSPVSAVRTAWITFTQ
jgi:TonB family protein